MWWQEEGRHADADRENQLEEDHRAADVFAEELGEMEDDELNALVVDEEYLARWPKAKPLIEWEIRHRRG